MTGRVLNTTITEKPLKHVLLACIQADVWADTVHTVHIQADGD